MPRPNEKKLGIYARNLLRSEMGRRLVRTGELAKKLNVDPLILSNKIGRGKFSVGFFFEMLHALGIKEAKVPSEIKEEYDFAAE